MPVNKDILLILKSSVLGDSEPDLGETMMEKFLQVLYESDELPAKIICMGTAVFLTTSGSRFNSILKKFQDRGSEVLSCCTCLEYYNRMDKLKVGTPTNMKETVGALLSFKKVIAF
jgi:selenium metabolism protein YedF